MRTYIRTDDCVVCLSLLQVICEQAVLTGNQTLQVSCCQM